MAPNGEDDQYGGTYISKIAYQYAILREKAKGRMDRR